MEVAGMNKLHEGKFVIWPTNFVEDLNDKNRTSKVATTRTEDGHRQNTKTSVTIYTKRRRNIGRPRKRWRDQFYFEDQGTGNTPNPS